jgi:hypothetical protein
MAVRVVERYPVVGVGGTILRILAAVIGILLMAAGVLASAVPLIYLIAVAISFGNADERADLFTRDSLVTVGVALAIVVVGLTAGLWLVRGRRRLGLFLRRFGFTDATKTISFAVAGGVGRAWRMITLDDAMVQSMGTSRRNVRMTRITLVLGLAGLGLILWWLFGGGLTSWSNGVFNDVQVKPKDNSLGAALGAAILGPIVAAVIVAFFLVLVVMLGAVTVSVAAFGGISYRAARRATRDATIRITDTGQAVNAARDVARRIRGVLSPRLIVASVNPAHWQAVVRTLAGVSDAVVIDVSQPTENLLWEVQTMRDTLGGRWVLVGHRELVARLAGAEAEPPESPYRRLAVLLDGQEVLPYGSDRAELRRFARTLRRKLRAVATSHR